MNKELVKAALIRAQRTLIQYLCATIPAGVTITPSMLMNIDLKYTFYVILAWFLMGVFLVAGTFFMAIETGLPEVQSAEEMRSADAIEQPVVRYTDEDEYDDLRIDEDVDEGEEDEMEQED